MEYADLGNISTIMLLLGRANFRYHGRLVYGNTTQYTEIWNKLFGNSHAKISVGRFKFFVMLIRTGQLQRMEAELDKLS